MTGATAMISTNEIVNFIKPTVRTPATRVLVILFAAAWLCSCSLSKAVDKTSQTIKRTSRKITREVKFTGDGFKPLVAISGFETIAEDSDETIKTFFDQSIPDYLNDRCNGVLTGRSEQAPFSDFFGELPRLANGQIDAYALSLISRQIGVNAVLIGSLKNIRKIDELQGVLWNKETIYLVRIVVRMEVYQPLTSTKILDSIYRRDVPIEEIEYDGAAGAGRWKMPPLGETLSDMLAEIGADICDALLDQPWSGFVTAVDGEKIVISAGSRAGLKPGVRLNVFDSTRTIEGADGQRFFMPGSNFAEIEIVAAAEDRSEARQIGGGAVKMGHSVRTGP